MGDCPITLLVTRIFKNSSLLILQNRLSIYKRRKIIYKTYVNVEISHNEYIGPSCILRETEVIRPGILIICDEAEILFVKLALNLGVKPMVVEK